MTKIKKPKLFKEKVKESEGDLIQKKKKTSGNYIKVNTNTNGIVIFENF